jgi:hypothetical protein
MWNKSIEQKEITRPQRNCNTQSGEAEINNNVVLNVVLDLPF